MARVTLGEGDVESESVTSLSLLLQIKSGEGGQEAWRAFVDRYGSRIYQWCLNRNLQPADAEDVCQDVLVKLARHLKTFEYDPAGTFRGWLRRLTDNALNDYFNERRRQAPVGVADNLVLLNQTEAREELIERLKGAFDLELLDKAKAEVRGRISESRFRAWELTAVEGLAGADVARQLDMKVATVYSARHQVQQLIQDQVRALERHVAEGFRSQKTVFVPKVDD